MVGLSSPSAFSESAQTNPTYLHLCCVVEVIRDYVRRSEMVISDAVNEIGVKKIFILYEVVVHVMCTVYQFM